MDQTRNLEQPTTLSQTNFSPNLASETALSRQSGFTLIEILLVLGIIVMVLSFGLPAINRITGQKLNSTARQFVGMLRTIRTDAILLNSIYRLNIDLDKNTYVVEAQKRLELLDENPIPAKKNPKKNEKDEPPPSNFAAVPKFTKEPKALPAGLVFEGVLKERDGLIKQGPAYVYFFPSGFNEQVILYINKDGASNEGYSLLLRPTAGRVEIYKKYVKAFN